MSSTIENDYHLRTPQRLTATGNPRGDYHRIALPSSVSTTGQMLTEMTPHRLHALVSSGILSPVGETQHHWKSLSPAAAVGPSSYPTDWGVRLTDSVAGSFSEIIVAIWGFVRQENESPVGQVVPLAHDGWTRLKARINAWQNADIEDRNNDCDPPSIRAVENALSFIGRLERGGNSMPSSDYVDGDGTISFRWQLSYGVALASFLSDGNLVAIATDTPEPLKIDEPYHLSADFSSLLDRLP